MSQEKAQLIAPQGHFTVPGLNVAGVVTASSFSGNCTGTASSLTQGSNVVVGVMTASSFAGDVFGNAAGLSTTTAGLKLGIVTSTSFAGNFTGIGSGLTGTPNIVAGLVTATQFVGNTPGLAAGISAGKNLAAGIVTATTFYGDGSALTGAGSTAFIRQSVSAAQTGTTNINLNDGNIIYYDPLYDINTLTFSNVKTADDISIIRSLDFATSLSSGGVDFDGTGDYLTVPNSSDFSFGTGDFTIEMWVYFDALAVSGPGLFQLSGSAGPSNVNYMTVRGQSFDQTGWDIIIKGNTSTSPETWQINQSGEISTGAWYHVALERKSSKTSLYVNGTALSMKLNGSGTAYTEIADTTDYDFTYLNISGYYDTSFLLNGKISNFRVVKGTAVYGGNFQRPRAELTNITNTKLLCCQSDSSTTAATVIPTGSITASGDPTATSVSLNSWSTPSISWPTSITWNGGSAPTLLGANSRTKAAQVFNLVTCDSGTNWYGYEEVSSDPDTNTLFTWGSNSDVPGSSAHAGMLGQNNQGAPTDRSSPVQVGTSSNWKEVTSSNSMLALKTDGTLWGWGNGSSGQFGLNDRTQRSSPTQIPGTTWSKLFKAQGGYGANLVHKTDGTLWAIGYNGEGGLGLNNITSYSSPVQLPGTTWSITSNDGRSSFGIKTDGTLWAWGYNQQGRLGLRPNIPSGQGEEMFSSPVQMAGNPGTGGRATGWVAVVPRMAMNEDGTLWRWGPADSGQGGNNDNNQSLSMVQIPGTTWGQDMSKISTDSSNTAAIKQDGTLWTWGRNDNYGQLGQNDRTSQSSPVQVPGTTWSSINVGSQIMRATKTDGTMWTWGRNDDERRGNLGLSNHGVHRSSPTQIPGTLWSQKANGMAGRSSSQINLKQSD